MIPPSPIARVRWRPWRIPFLQPIETASGSIADRSGVVFAIETESGAVGLGEASPLPSAGLAMASIEERLSRWVPALLGRVAADVWAEMPTCGDMSAVEVAVETTVADLVAQEERLPLADLLASRAGLGQPARRPIPVNALVAATEPPAAAREANAAASDGFRTFKLKVGRDLAADNARLAGVRASLGAGADLRIDANGGWGVEEAITALTALSVHDIALCEQPVAAGRAAPEQLAQVRAASRVPIAADESCGSNAELEALIAADAVDAIVVKPLRTGLREALSMIATTRLRALPTIVTTTFDTSIGTALALHLAALLPEPRPACGLATLGLLKGDIASGVPEPEAGTIAVPTTPGLGVTLDLEALDRFATGPWVESHG